MKDTSLICEEAPIAIPHKTAKNIVLFIEYSLFFSAKVAKNSELWYYSSCFQLFFLPLLAQNSLGENTYSFHQETIQIHDDNKSLLLVTLTKTSVKPNNMQSDDKQDCKQVKTNLLRDYIKLNL